jgi:MSHA pilin protein MshA
MKTRSQAGFTLIELVVVISILAILAAFAIPKFIAVETQARTSVVNAVAGSLRSTTSLGHALTVANGNGSASNTSITMEGVTVTMANGYPDAAGIVLAMSASGVTVTTTATTATYTVSGDLCRNIYSLNRRWKRSSNRYKYWWLLIFIKNIKDSLMTESSQY